MSVVQLYYHLAPQSEQGVVTKAFIRLLKGHRSVGVGGAGVGRWVHLFGGHEHMLVGYKGDHDLVVDCEGAIFLLQYETTSVGDWVEPGFDTHYPPLLSPSPSPPPPHLPLLLCPSPSSPSPHREVQSVVLSNIAALSVERPVSTPTQHHTCMSD